jgi:hypothetical protein
MPRERTIGISLAPHVEAVLRARAEVEGRKIATLAALAVESWLASTPTGTLPVPLAASPLPSPAEPEPVSPGAFPEPVPPEQWAKLARTHGPQRKRDSAQADVRRYDRT